MDNKRTAGRPLFNFTEEMNARIIYLMTEKEYGSLRILNKLKEEGYSVPSRKTLWTQMQKLKNNNSTECL